MQNSKEMENVRKSSRILQKSKFEKHMSMFISKGKKMQKRRHGSESSGEDDLPEKVQKKDIKPPVKTTPKPKEKVTPKKKSPIKEEPLTTEDEEEADDIPEEELVGSPDKDYLSTLDLRRVGDDTPKNNNKDAVQLNARGMPQRIRKRNKYFYDDNVVNFSMKNKPRIAHTPKVKDEKKQPIRNRGRVDKKEEVDVKHNIAPVEDSREANSIRQKIGMTLRNLLKLPKAQRWVFNEWFYSNIDSALFLGSNDFLLCLRETFPNLKTTMLNRAEWCIVRRLMGKPRRCSQAFFNEERVTLEKRRNAIRMIQQRKLRDSALSKDLPDKIPLQLSVNSRVTARLRKPQAGLFTGKVDAVDPSNHTYRITFDRPGLGTHSIPDYEVLLDGEADTVSLSTLMKRYNSVKNSSPRPAAKFGEPKVDWRGSWSENTTAKFHKSFYEMVVRICKIIKEKRSKVETLKEMNAEAERISSQGLDYPPRFQRQYAGIIIDLESLNISLERFLSAVQKYCHDNAPDACKVHMLIPSYLRERSLNEARELVNNHTKDNSVLKNHKLIDLVTELVALMIQVQTLSRSKNNSHEIQILKQSVAKIKSMISPTNHLVFQNKVEVHVQYIESTLGSDSNPLLTTAQSSKQSS